VTSYITVIQIVLGILYIRGVKQLETISSGCGS